MNLSDRSANAKFFNLTPVATVTQANCPVHRGITEKVGNAKRVTIVLAHAGDATGMTGAMTTTNTKRKSRFLRQWRQCGLTRTVLIFLPQKKVEKTPRKVAFWGRKVEFQACKVAFLGVSDGFFASKNRLQRFKCGTCHIL